MCMYCTQGEFSSHFVFPLLPELSVGKFKTEGIQNGRFIHHQQLLQTKYIVVFLWALHRTKPWASEFKWGENPHSGKINPACMQHHYICNIHLQVNVSLHQQDTNPRNKMTRLTSSVEISPGFLSPQADFPGDGPQQFDDVCQVIVIATEVFSRIGLK